MSQVVTGGPHHARHFTPRHYRSCSSQPLTQSSGNLITHTAKCQRGGEFALVLRDGWRNRSHRHHDPNLLGCRPIGLGPSGARACPGETLHNCRQEPRKFSNGLMAGRALRSCPTSLRKNGESRHFLDRSVAADYITGIECEPLTLLGASHVPTNRPVLLTLQVFCVRSDPNRWVLSEVSADSGCYQQPGTSHASGSSLNRMVW